MKTKEELEQIKEEYVGLNKKLAELTDEELKQVTGGFIISPSYGYNSIMKCENPECGKGMVWKGKFYENVNYKCPYCGEMTFKMKELLYI